MGDVKTYKLEYKQGTAVPFFIALCEHHVGRRLINGASILEKRRPVTATQCADCHPRETLRR